MSLQPEAPPALGRPDTEEFSPSERALLLKLAHDSSAATLAGASLQLIAPTAHLNEARGAFTTLHLAENLRGCIGYVFPVHPLYRTVADTARAAAFEDPRFEL